MPGPAIDYHYRYLYPSALAPSAMAPSATAAPNEPELRLATFSEDDSHPYFFTGTLRQPYQVSRLMLALVWLLRMRFHTRQDMIPAGVADPIVTAHEAFLRMEVFSACCSVYARLDLPESAIDGETLGRGTTNVDFNPAMIAALGKIRPTSDMQLSVGADEVMLASGDNQVVEKRVPLPVRWLKGLLAVTAYGSGLQKVHDVPGPQAVRFLRSLPRKADHRTRWWVCRSGSGLRLSQRPSRDAMQTGGLERLRVLEDLAHMAKTMRVYGSEEHEASSWELDFGDARFTMLMTHDVWRGLSGEGQMLQQMTRKVNQASMSRVKAALKWQAMIKPEDVLSSGVDPSGIDDSFAQLASLGLVGYDSACSHYFHRELPFDMSFVEKLQPRIKNARKLIEKGAIRQQSGNVYSVPGADAAHTVRIVDDEFRCTCPWFAKHKNRRGPCKHILAIQIMKEASSDT